MNYGDKHTEDSLNSRLGRLYGIERGLDCGPNIIMDQYWKVWDGGERQDRYKWYYEKVIVRTPIESECAGADLLSTCIDDSDWVGDLDDDGFGEFIDIELEGIKYLKYDGDLDELEVYFNNSKIWYIDGDDISDYLVKIEIVNIEK